MRNNGQKLHHASSVSTAVPAGTRSEKLTSESWWFWPLIGSNLGKEGERKLVWWISGHLLRPSCTLSAHTVQLYWNISPQDLATKLKGHRSHCPQLASFSHKNPRPVSHTTYKRKPEESEIVQPCQFHNRSWYMEDRNTFLVAHSTDHLCWPAISFDSFAWANDLKINHRTWTLPRGDLPLESKCYWDIESRRHSVSRRSRA